MTIDEYRTTHGTGCFDGFWNVGMIAGVPAIPVTLHTLIDQTVRELNKIYIPYVSSWVRQRKVKMLDEIMEVESGIQVAILCEDEVTLRTLLKAYYDIWMEMIVEFEAGGRKYVPF